MNTKEIICNEYCNDEQQPQGLLDLIKIYHSIFEGKATGIYILFFSLIEFFCYSHLLLLLDLYHNSNFFPILSRFFICSIHTHKYIHMMIVVKKTLHHSCVITYGKHTI